MLSIGEVDLVGSPGHHVTDVVQETVVAPQSVGSSAATRARAAFITSTACDDFGLRQVLDTSDALCHIGKVFTGSGHGDVLQALLSSPGYIAKVPSSPPRNLCIVATVSENLGVTGGFVNLSVGDGTKLLLSHFAPGMTGVEDPISIKAALYGFGPVHRSSNLR
jgi:hypothetical protein